MSGGGGPNVQINVTANTSEAIAQISALSAKMSTISSGLSRSFGAAAGSLSNIDVHLRRINANMVAGGFAVVGLARKFEDFVKIAGDMEQMRVRISAMSASNIEASKTMDELLTIARKTPFSLNSVTNAFIKLKSSGIAPIVDDQGNGPLKDLLDAIAALGGASNDLLERSAIAISQMAGKGVVSMEELRQQLGEALPTALRILSKESGRSIGSLVKDISRGKVTFEWFKDTFFPGLRKAYEGMGEVIAKTFLGAIGQTGTELQHLSDVLFNQTGTLNKFAIAITMANEQLRKFSDYLKTPAGQDWVDKIWKSFEQLVIYASKAIEPVSKVVSMIGDLGKILSQSASGLPPELVGGGLIGYILFGRGGVIPGALLFQFADVLSTATSMFATTIKNNTSLTESIVGGAGGVLAGGIFGYLLMGPTGALLASANAIFDTLTNKYKNFLIGIKFVSQYISDYAASGPFSPPDPKQVVMEIGSYIDAINKGIDEQTKTSAPNPIEKIFSNIDTTALKQSAEDITTRLQEIKLGIKSVGDQADQSGKQTSAAIREMKSTVDGTTQSVTQGTQKQAASFYDIINATASAQNSLSKFYETAKDQSAQKRFSVWNNYLAQVQDGFEKLQRSGGSYADALNLIAQDQDNLKKTFSNLSGVDKYGQMGKDIQDTIAWLDKWKQHYEGLASASGQVIDKVQSDNQNVAQSYSQVVSSISTLDDNVKQFIDNIGNGLQSKDTIAQSARYLTDTIDQYKQAVQDSNATDQQKAQLLQVLNDQYALVTDAASKATGALQNQGAASNLNSEALAKVNRSVSDLNDRAQKMILGARFDEEAQRIQAAKGDINNVLQDIAVEIEDVQNKLQKGLITPEAAQSAIANLNQIRDAVTANSSAIIAQASSISKAWIDMGQEIYSSIQSSLGDAIYGLVTHTKSLRDAMVDMWNAVTKAVANYLAKLIMISLFGGGGNIFGGGGGLGGLFGSNQGSVLQFAGGGGFTVDGRTGFDNNLVAMRVSRGERVTVQTAAQQRASSGGYGDIHIHAVDADSVRKLFMREGAALQQALKQRLRLNHPMDT